MDSTAIQHLQALLLAFSHPEVSLNASEKDKFFEVGEQLQLDPDDWEFIWEGLQDIITKNIFLSQAFKIELERLKKVPSNKWQELEPTQEEFKQIIAADRKIETRGYSDNDEADIQGLYILNAARRILKEDDPAEITKKLRWIDRIKKILILLTDAN